MMLLAWKIDSGDDENPEDAGKERLWTKAENIRAVILEGRTNKGLCPTNNAIIRIIVCVKGFLLCEVWNFN